MDGGVDEQRPSVSRAWVRLMNGEEGAPHLIIASLT